MPYFTLSLVLFAALVTLAASQFIHHDRELIMKRSTKRRIYTALIYTGLIFSVVTATATAYSAIYYAHHDSPYAEGCPEQKTLFWCK